MCLELSVSEKENLEKETRSGFVAIVLTQAVCIAVILIAVLIIKFFFGQSFREVQKWYGDNILDETCVSDVFSEELS